MKKLTTETKPKNITLHQIWKLFVSDTGNETTDFVIQSLDTFYPNMDREDMDVFTRLNKYYEAKSGYARFCFMIKGVGNG